MRDGGLVLSGYCRKSHRNVLLLFSVLLLAANGWLLQRNRALEKLLAVPPLKPDLQAGARVPPLKGATITGTPVSLDFKKAGTRTVLFVLSPSCSHCDANWPVWDDLRSRIGASAKIFFVDLSSQITPDYLTRHRIAPEQLITHVTPESFDSYAFQATPQTVLIGPDGRVVKSWTGELARGHLPEVQAVLQL